MTDVAADFAAASDALLAENAALKNPPQNWRIYLFVPLGVMTYAYTQALAALINQHGGVTTLAALNALPLVNVNGVLFRALNQAATDALRQAVWNMNAQLPRVALWEVANAAYGGFDVNDLVRTNVAATAGGVGAPLSFSLAQNSVWLHQPAPSAVVYADTLLDVETATYNPLTRQGTGGAAVAAPSLGAALERAASGAVVYVRSGIYVQRWTVTPICCFRITRPLTVRNYDDEQPVITFDPSDPPFLNPVPNCAPIIRVEASHVTLEGLTIVGTRPLMDVRGADADVSVQLNDGLTGITIRRNTFREGGHGCIKWGVSENLLIEQNVFEHFGTTAYDHAIYTPSGAAATRITIRHNVFQHGNGRGVNLYYLAAQNVDVYGNLFLNLKAGALLVSGANNRICNNTIWNCHDDFANRVGGLHVYGATCTGLIIRNNLLLHNTPADITLDAANGLAGSDIGGNVYVTALTYTLSPADFDHWWTDDGTDMQVSALFDAGLLLDPPQDWRDLRLLLSSPLNAAGAGSPFDTLLDPLNTTCPTPLQANSSQPVGGFAALAAGGC